MSLIYRYDEITQVSFEVTTRCNAACPLCPRNDNGGPVISTLPLTELTLADCKRIFPTDFVERSELWIFCGIYGDPCVAQETSEICAWLIDVNPDVEIRICTNGSIRRPEWWSKLAQTLGKNGVVEWGLDGLRDTNHLYRKNTNWDIIMRNVAAFHEAGGRSTWQFIPFSHNEHQIEEARRLAKLLGFEHFKIKRTDRLNHSKDPSVERVANVVDRKTNEVTHQIKSAVKKENKNNIMNKGQSLVDAFGGIEGYRKRTPIFCMAKHRKEIYVSAEGLVFPCCYLAPIYHTTDTMERLIEWGGTELIDTRFLSLKEIIEGTIFKNIAASWTNDNRIPRCAMSCGIIRNVSQDITFAPLDN